jgi:hypothetical protein
MKNTVWATISMLQAAAIIMLLQGGIILPGLGLNSINGNNFLFLF